MKPNTQAIERAISRTDGHVDVREIFYTIQGEGPFAGCPAIFVRLAGCNLRCPGCDTDYTSSRELMEPRLVLERIATVLLDSVGLVTFARLPLIVITGGEPFRQRLAPLVKTLHFAGYKVQIETNGTLFEDDFPWGMATIVCSPKTGRINYDLSRRVAAFKYVVKAGYIDRDGLPFQTLGNAGQTEVARPPEGSQAEVYVQPLDEQDDKLNEMNTRAAVQSCLKFGHRLCIQTHKLVGLP